MNSPLFQTFVSPYHAFSLHSARYRHVVPHCVVALLALPLLFLIFRSVSVYYMGYVIVFILFPFFLWIYLNTDEVTDIKLDAIKVFVLTTFYFSYLLALSWVMTRILKAELTVEYMLITLGYIFLLFVVSIMITGVSFFHRYAQRIIRAKNV